MSRTVRNCETRFRFRCPKSWESLDSTAEEGVRFCTVCEKDVYFCADLDDLVRHAEAGHCVAVHEEEREIATTGMPAPDREF